MDKARNEMIRKINTTMMHRVITPEEEQRIDEIGRRARYVSSVIHATKNLAEDAPSLIIVKDDVVQMAFPMRKKRLTLGRSEQSDICIDFEKISRAHCVFNYENDAWTIKDCGSMNGIMVNGKKVMEKILCDGDLIEISVYQIVFADRPPELPEDFDSVF